MLAKVCSDQNKPNGQFYLEPDVEKISAFLENLPIRKIGGIGNVTFQQLNCLGVSMCSDLWTHRGRLRLLFSELSSTFFLNISLGLGSTTLESWTERDRKSISCERTFADCADKDKL